MAEAQNLCHLFAHFQSPEWITISWPQSTFKSSGRKPSSVLLSLSPGGKSLPRLRAERVDLERLSTNNRKSWVFSCHSGIFRMRFSPCLEGLSFSVCPKPAFVLETRNLQCMMEECNPAPGLARRQEEFGNLQLPSAQPRQAHISDFLQRSQQRGLHDEL